MGALTDIVDAFTIDTISESYASPIEITDLKDELGTKGHVLVIRGDKAYADKLTDTSLANPKFWLYENLINSPRVQELLRTHPAHKLFDGVGHSALEAIGFHTRRLGRKAIVVMAREMLPDPTIFDRYDIEIIHADGIMEEGYVQKQSEILKQRDDIIPIHQALYGAQALAPIGNRVVQQLEELDITPDFTFWCLASGSNAYGIGGRLKQKFSQSETIIVEPSMNRTIDAALDFTNPKEVKQFARTKLHTSLADWDGKYSGIFPLHATLANRYLLLLWAQTGKIGFDNAISTSTNDVFKTQRALSEISSEYNWTQTTALTLVPAIERAKQGQNVLVMAYGKNRETGSRRLLLENTL